MTTLPGSWQAVCFDRDGLLVDTEPIWMDAKEVLFERYGIGFDAADHSAVFGTSEVQSAAYFARRMGLPASATERIRVEYLDIVVQKLDTDIPVQPGALELIASLRGRVPIALATNTRRPIAEMVLRRVGLSSAFDAMATSDETQPKPAPHLYLLACERLGIAPGSAVGLEDSPTGVRAVKAAGMYCIAVPSAPDTDVSPADEIRGSLLELIPTGGDR
ncbi:MAG: HAD family phosphatase [Chloroflexi bacterium]|nr:HAD family phosphatase [Chloroflexota bacterium]